MLRCKVWRQATSPNSLWRKKENRLADRVFSLEEFDFHGKCVALFLVGFMVGAAMQIFTCKTRLYEVVAAKKQKRRHDLDEWVLEYREQVEKWAMEDKLLWEAKQEVQRLKAEAGNRS